MDLELIKSVIVESPHVMRSAAGLIVKAGYSEPGQHLNDIADLSEGLVAASRGLIASCKGEAEAEYDVLGAVRKLEEAVNAFMNYEMEIPPDIALLHALGALGGGR